MGLDLRRFRTPEALYDEAERLLRDAFTRCSEAPFAVMLSGGSTPLEVYRRIAQSPPTVSEGLHILFSDERHVSEQSPESNQFQASRMMEALGIPPGRVLGVDTSRPLASSAMSYHDQIDAFLENGGTIRLGLLGLGADGHTASLFRLEEAGRRGGEWAIPVERPTPPHRVSVTPRLLNRVERLLFWVIESGKEQAVSRLIQEPSSIPAGEAIRERDQTELWLA